MIAHNISTALIIESDADWDMRIRYIMNHLAHGIRSLIDWPFNRPHHVQSMRIQPYGDSWDIVWIGNCGSSHEGNTRIYSWNDITVPPKDKRWSIVEQLSEQQYLNGTRNVFQHGRTICSTAYAISLEGARKLVKYFEEVDANLDEMLNWVCQHAEDMLCLGVWPPIMTPADTKSNIDHDRNEDVTRAGERDDRPLIVKPGPAIQYSAWRNARRIIDDGAGSDDWIAEWFGSWGWKNGTWDAINTQEAVVE